LFCGVFVFFVSLVNFWSFNFFCNRFLLLFVAHFFPFLCSSTLSSPLACFFFRLIFSFFSVSFLSFCKRHHQSSVWSNRKCSQAVLFIFFWNTSFPFLLKHISKQTKSFGYWNISPRTIPSDLSLSFLWLVSSGHRGSSVGFFHSLLAWFTLTFGYVTEPRVRTWCLRCSLFFFVGVFVFIFCGDHDFPRHVLYLLRGSWYGTGGLYVTYQYSFSF